MTRARDRLILTRARQRRSYGLEGLEGTRPSRFLREIPDQLLESVNAGPASSKPRTNWDSAVNSLAGVDRFLQQRGFASSQRREPVSFSRPAVNRRWKLGTQVRHAKYGLGTVIECEGDGEDTKLTVSFPGFGRKKLVERYAALEKA